MRPVPVDSFPPMDSALWTIRLMKELRKLVGLALTNLADTHRVTTFSMQVIARWRYAVQVVNGREIWSLREMHGSVEKDLQFASRSSPQVMVCYCKNTRRTIGNASTQLVTAC